MKTLSAVLLAAAFCGLFGCANALGAPTSSCISYNKVATAPNPLGVANAPDTLWVDAHADATRLERADVFATVNDALRQAEALQQTEAYSEQHPLTICIAPAVYWIDDPDDPAIRLPEPPERAPYGMVVRMSHVRLVGLSPRAEDVVLASNRGQTQGADGNFTTFHFIGDDIRAENITFGNYCNVDLVYPLDPSQNRRRREDAIVQAQLIIMDGDKAMARNCRFISRLNLCPFVGARRALFDHCYMECTADALSDVGVYLHCSFTFFSAAPLYATRGTGAVFLDCDFHCKVRGRMYLVKETSPVTQIDCRWTTDDPDLALDWARDPGADLRSCQHNLTLNGQPLRMDSSRPWLTVDLTDRPVLQAYKLGTGTETADYNVYNLTCGTDGWNPLGIAQEQQQRVRSALVLSHSRATLESGVDTLRLGANLVYPTPDLRYDASQTPEQTVHWSVSAADRAYVSLAPQADGSCVVVGTNDDEQTRTINLLARTDAGIEAACVLTVKPRQLPAPAFVRSPGIRRSGDELTVDYALDLGGREDRSLITWYRCTGPDAADATPVAVSRLDTPKRTYTLTEDDLGYHLRATVDPRHLRSLPGQPQTATTEEPIREAPRRDSLVTDFVDLPTDYQPEVRPGWWTVDIYRPLDTQAYDWGLYMAPEGWFYGRGRDGASRATGLLQATRGARLLYTPMPRDYGDMSLELYVDPAKSAGQGFGSATGQYMDVCIKMDNATLTGYALRIIRTPQNDAAVDFLLVRYQDGEVTPLTPAVSALCYRTGCTIRLALHDGSLTAHVETDGRIPAEKVRPGLLTEVDLQATVPPSTDGGIGIQHTGTVGQGATMLRRLSVYWQ